MHIRNCRAGAVIEIRGQRNTISNSIWTKKLFLISKASRAKFWKSHNLPDSRHGVSRPEREATLSLLSCTKVKYKFSYISTSKPLRGVQKIKYIFILATTVSEMFKCLCTKFHICFEPKFPSTFSTTCVNISLIY